MVSNYFILVSYTRIVPFRLNTDRLCKFNGNIYKRIKMHPILISKPYVEEKHIPQKNYQREHNNDTATSKEKLVNNAET